MLGSEGLGSHFFDDNGNSTVMAAPGRLAALAKAQCAIFQTAYNPTSARTGAKYLRARLRGPSMVNYYPKDMDLCMSKFVKEWPELELVNFAEAQRLWDVDMMRARGKGAPAKAKDKSLSHSDIIWNVTQVAVSRPESPDTKKAVAVAHTTLALILLREILCHYCTCNKHVLLVPFQDARCRSRTTDDISYGAGLRLNQARCMPGRYLRQTSETRFALTQVRACVRSSVLLMDAQPRVLFVDLGTCVIHVAHHPDSVALGGTVLR